MGQIHILSEEISSKIAAGEVVERPASVIKELVENSIDAGASAITVQIREGGVSYMRVTDNGTGMLKEDAELCFIRHATSKISSSEDLDAIYTLGFRGEALASIAAVARVDIYTKRHDEDDGIHIKAEGGTVYAAENFGTPFGTNVIVRDLFFNTPARMKFLKKNATEAGYIGDIMAKFILSHPEISIKFINGAKEQYFSPGNNRIEDCVYTVYGKDYAKNIIKMDYTVDNIRVSGVIGKSVLSRPNRGYQSFFINGRYVKSPLIARAVEEAYKNQIMIGKFPMAVVNLETDPSTIDINVHPTKLEVKFSNENAVYTAVYFTVKNALYNTLSVPSVSHIGNDNGNIFEEEMTGGSGNMSENKKNKENDEESDIVNEANISAVTAARERINAERSGGMKKNREDTAYAEENEKSGDNDERAAGFKPGEQRASGDVNNVGVTEITYGEKTEGFEILPDEMSSLEYDRDVIFGSNILNDDDTEEKSIVDDYITEMNDYNESVKLRQNVAVDLLDKSDISDFKIIGQIFDTYIIIQKESDVLFIDQHAAHERLKYEQLKKSAENHTISSQILLVPAIVSMTAVEYAVYNENKEFFENMGFNADDFGENCIAVRSSPVVLEESELSSLIIELITYIRQSKKEIVSEKYDKMMYTIACKSAIKANRPMNTEEIKSLVNDILELDNINTCPHGRPIMISMSQKQVEKEFKRIV
ncbi:MAG: DNA mismatch repair endonuclease MutL [Oscillospiraceae bacterium]|nr:DNA mismatch repair endonuclease MutL [Oscillospiraceae bacterium]